MKTIEINMLTISELTERAKEAAYQNWLKTAEYFWEDENRNSLAKFADIFPVSVSDWRISGEYRDYIAWHFTGDESIKKLSGFRLARYIWNNYFHDIFKGKYYGKLVYTFKDGTPIPISKEHPAGCRHVKRYSNASFETSCVLTGYCIDDNILDPIYEFLKKPDPKTTFSGLMKTCLQAWLKAVSKDYKFCHTLEYFAEAADANGWEFTEEGEII